MENLTAIVVNRTELLLTIRDFYGEGSKNYNEMYGSERHPVPAGRTYTVKSDQFAVAYNKRLKALGDSKLISQQIHVHSCEHLLLVLKHDPFYKNKGKELILDMVDNRLRYALVSPNTNIVDQWIWGEPSVCSLTELMLEQRIWDEQGFDIGRMEGLKTKVVNNTELVLTLKGCSEEIRLAAGGTGMFSSGKLCRTWFGKLGTTKCGKLCRNWFGKLGTTKCGKLGTNKHDTHYSCQKIRVSSGEYMLLMLNDNDFQNNNKGKDLIFELVNDSLRYTFVYPTAKCLDFCDPPSQWITCPLNGIPASLKEKEQREVYEQECQSLKTRVVNKTVFLLTLAGYYGNNCRKKIRVGEGGAKSLCLGEFFKREKFEKAYRLEMHVLRGVEVMLVLDRDHFHKNQGKQLILDMSEGKLSYAFVPPTPSMFGGLLVPWAN